MWCTILLYKRGVSLLAKLTPRQRKEVVYEYAKGATQQQIGKKYGVSDVAISKILAKDESLKRLEEIKTELSSELDRDFEEFIRSRAGKTSDIIELSQNLIIERLKNGKISVKEAVGACKVFSELIMNTPKQESKDREQPRAIKVIIEDASEADNGTND